MKIAKLSSLVLVPLAVCTTVPAANSDVNALVDEALVEHLKNQAALLAVAAVGEELSNFFVYAQQVGDEALSNYEGKEAIKGWPNDVDELVKLMDTKLTAGRADVTAKSSNPLQDLINGVGNAVNSVTGAITGTAKNITSGITNITSGITNSTSHTNNTGNPLTNLVGGVTSGLGNILGGNGTKTNSTGGNPIGDLVGGITGGLGNITAGLGNALGGKTNSSSPNPIGDLLGGVTSGLGNIIGGVANNTANGLGGFLTTLTNSTGNALGHLTDGLINPHFLNDTFGFLGKSVAGLLDGSLDLGAVLQGGLDKILNFTGGTNPLGKFIQSLAQYLSSNSDGLLANIIKFVSFIQAVTNTIAHIAQTVFHNITQDITNDIGKFVQGVISKVFFGGVFGLHRLQTMTADEAMLLQEHFLNAVRAQGSPATVSFVEALTNSANDMVQKMLTADSHIFAVLTDPTEGNIRRFVLTTAKVLTDHNA